MCFVKIILSNVGEQGLIWKKILELSFKTMNHLKICTSRSHWATGEGIEPQIGPDAAVNARE